MRSSSEVWRAITALEIADADTCRSWASEIASILPPEDLASGPKTLRGLMEKGLLTAYQSGALERGEADALRAGRWLVLEPVATKIWKGWFSARDSEGNSAWIRRVTVDELASLEPCQASRERSLQLAKLSSDRLQHIWPVEFAAGNLVAAVEPVEGELLIDVVKKIGPMEKWSVLQGLVKATSVLHRSGIVHGRIAPDRIVVKGGECQLLIDPVCQRTAMPAARRNGLIATELGVMSDAHFLAPEFVAPDPSPTMASDVYSLGCVWWWLFNEKPASDGATSEAVMAAHAGPLPKVSRRIKAAVKWSAEIEKCLQHALARNLDGRFPDAGKLQAALDAACKQTESKTRVSAPHEKTPVPKSTKVAEPKKEHVPQNRTIRTSVDEPLPTASVVSGEAKKKATQTKGTQELKPANVGIAEGTSSNDDAPVKANASEVQKPGDRDSASKAVAVSSSDRSSQQRSRRSRGRSNKWLLPTVGGCGFLIVLLAVLKLSGALEFSPAEQAARPAVPYRPPLEKPAAPATNPVSSAAKQYNVVDSDVGLWLPPATTELVPVDLLPPGGQIFVSVKSEWLGAGSSVAAALGERLQPLRELLAEYGGLPLEAWNQATLAFYPPESPGEFPQVAVRYELRQAASQEELAANWSGASTAVIDGKQFYASEQMLYYSRAREGNLQVDRFSCGPVSRMQEVVELGGAAGPMVPAVEQLWELSDSEADFAVFGAPQFLFTVGRNLLERSPPRLASSVRKLLATDRRAALLQTRFAPTWYAETAIVGRSATSAVAIAENLREGVTNWPQGVEQWFSDEAPHAAWRAIALRYPQMLRVASGQLRHGVEDGVAKANFYLPAEAAPNLVLAVWLAAQPGATQRDNGALTITPDVQPTLTVEQYLNRSIRLSFAQEPIEVALQMVADEANDNLPSGTLPMRFELDGDAFELAGITRNQQLRDFDHRGSKVREALTDMARRGNPVATVTDTRDKDQRLIWVVRPDPASPGQMMVSLTTRAAAASRNDALTIEFAPELE